MNMIAHPVLWRCFTGLSDEEKHRFLDGNQAELAKLAKSYILWFFAKVEKRVGDSKLDVIRVAIKKIAQRFVDDPERDGRWSEDWISACSEAGCFELNHDRVFYEAISAGVLELKDAGERIWKWRRPWLCEFFAAGVDHA
jgi:hypothetical protein